MYLHTCLPTKYVLKSKKAFLMLICWVIYSHFLPFFLFFSFSVFLQPTTTTDAKCSTISTVTDFCTHIASNPTMEYNPSAADATCGGNPCDKTSMPDQGACCKDVVMPKCSSTESDTGFCDDGQVYNADNAESSCLNSPCTAADVRCHCSFCCFSSYFCSVADQ